MAIQQYDYKTSTQVKNQLDEQVNKMRQGDANQQKMANNQLWINNLFGSPELRKAKDLEKVIETTQLMEREEGEDILDFQIRQQKAVMTGAAPLDPKVSVQASANIANLIKDKKAQARITEKTAQENELFERDTKKFEDSITPMPFKTDPITGIQTPVYGYGLTKESTPEEMAAIMQELEGREDGIYQWGNRGEALELEDPNVNKNTRRTNNSDRMDILEQAGAMGDMADSSFKFAREVNANPDVMFALDKTAELSNDLGSIDKIAEGIGAFFGREDTGMFRRNLFDDEFNAWMEQESVSSGRARAYAVELAYKLAKALDPGGRLSDQDIEIAKQMIMGNGSPASIEPLMRERLAHSRRKLEDMRYTLDKDDEQGLYLLDRQLDYFNKADGELAQMRDYIAAQGGGAVAAQIQRMRVGPSDRDPTSRVTGEVLGGPETTTTTTNPSYTPNEAELYGKKWIR